MPPMAIKRPPYSLHASHAKHTATALRELARRADREELIGVAVASWTSADQPDLRVAGYLRNRQPTAHYAVSLLQAALLYGDTPV